VLLLPVGAAVRGAMGGISMSGEKCTSFSVEDNIRRREARLRELRDAASAVEARLREVARQAGSLVAASEMPAFAADASEATLRQYGIDAAALIEKIEARLLRRSMLQQLDAHQNIGGAEAWNGPAEAAKPADEAPKGRAERAKLAERLANRVTEPSADEAERIQLLASRLVACENAQRASDIEEELRHTIIQSNRAADRRLDDSRRAATLLDELRGLSGEAVAAARNEVESALAEHRPLSDADLERVAHVRDEAIERSDQEYAMDVLREELINVGYDVPVESFTTAMASGGALVVRDQRNPDYGIKLTIDRSRDEFGMVAVRLDDGSSYSPLQQQHDKQAEDDFCGRHTQMRARLERAGIASHLRRHYPSGVRPLEVIKVQVGQAQEAAEHDAPISRPFSR
jgi:hypothetical protein